MKKSEIQITKPIADTIAKICFDTVEFSRLYDQDKGVQQIFQCNDNIKKGLKWFIGSETKQTMAENVMVYKKAVKNTLDVYNNLKLSFTDKEKIISTLINLNQHLTELQEQIK
ncbi:hypothetical protein V8G69_11765 [Gaetbulibacter sp. M235]|uniref:hypothetical protein n=1 Tax=Gaetbulibacter sp. M235 TaxID=3126510 RepID=UPI00374E7BE0